MLTDASVRRDQVAENTESRQGLRHHGLWWRVDQPAQQVRGVLEADSEGKLRLELFGAFGDPALSFLALPEGQFRIIGETEEGRPATLERCFAITTKGAWTQPRQLWNVGEALIGAALPADKPWQFFGCHYSIPGLTRWVDRRSPEPFVEWNEEKKPTRAGVATTVKAWPLWTLADGTQVRLVRGFVTKTIGEFSGAIDAEVTASVHGTTARGSDELQDAVSLPLRVLVTLATGRFTTAVRGSAILEPYAEGEHRPLVDWRWPPQSPQINVEKAKYAFTYADAAALSEDALQSWYRRTGELTHALPLYLAAVREGAYAEQSFLMTAQALEGYHRTNADDRQTLRLRLKALVWRAGAFEPQICGVDTELFLSRAIDTRNYYTHWSADLRDKALRGEHAVYLTQRLLALLEMQLLLDVGFALDHKVFKGIAHRRLSWLAPIPEY